MFSLLRTVGLLMVSLALLKAAPPPAPNCRSGVGPHFGGSEPPLMIDLKCTDPDYNEATFVIDSTQQHDLKLPDGTTIPYTEVKGHFPATMTKAQLAPGVLESPTTVSHSVTWRFEVDPIGWTKKRASLDGGRG